MDRSPTIAKLRGACPQLSVGTLTANMMDQASAVRTLEQEGVQLLHFDVMDGRVFPKITVGSGFVAGLKTTLLKDVHLLVEEPEKHVKDFAQAGADIIVFALEHTEDIGGALKLIGEAENANDRGKEIAGPKLSKGIEQKVSNALIGGEEEAAHRPPACPGEVLKRGVVAQDGGQSEDRSDNEPMQMFHKGTVVTGFFRLRTQPQLRPDSECKKDETKGRDLGHCQLRRFRPCHLRLRIRRHPFLRRRSARTPYCH